MQEFNPSDNILFATVTVVTTLDKCESLHLNQKHQNFWGKYRLVFLGQM